MKRSLIMGIMIVMTTGLLTSCSKGGKDNVNQSAAAVDDKLVTTQTDTSKGTETKSTSGDEVSSSAKKSEKGRTINISDADKLSYDYTDVGSIPLEKGTYIAVVAKGMDSGYWKTVTSGAEQALSDLNAALGYSGKDKIKMTFDGPDDSSDIDTQINTIDTVLAENPSVLCLCAIDMTSCEPQLETAEENGIPVVIIDSGVQKNDKVAMACETNNKAAGAEAAKRLSESISESGNVAVIGEVKLAQNAANRVQGFQEEIANNHKNVKIADVKYEEDLDKEAGDSQEAIDGILDDLTKEHPDLKGIFCTNEGVGTKVLDYMDRNKDLDLKIVGFDSGEKQQQAIKDDKMVGVISQNPYTMGYISIVGAARLSVNLPIDQYVNTGYIWVDKSNIGDSDVQDFLYK